MDNKETLKISPNMPYFWIYVFLSPFLVIDIVAFFILDAGSAKLICGIVVLWGLSGLFYCYVISRIKVYFYFDGIKMVDDFSKKYSYLSWDEIRFVYKVRTISGLSFMVFSKDELNKDDLKELVRTSFWVFSSKKYIRANCIRFYSKFCSEKIEHSIPETITIRDVGYINYF